MHARICTCAHRGVGEELVTLIKYRVEFFVPAPAGKTLAEEITSIKPWCVSGEKETKNNNNNNNDK